MHLPKSDTDPSQSDTWWTRRESLRLGALEMGDPANSDLSLSALVAMMRQQYINQEQHLIEERLWRARQAVTEKLGRFSGKNISHFIKVYEQIMEDNGVGEVEIVENFSNVS